jgi:hypothetical protein
MKNHLLKKKKVSKIYKLYRLSIADQFEILIFYTGIIKKKKKERKWYLILDESESWYPFTCLSS